MSTSTVSGQILTRNTPAKTGQVLTLNTPAKTGQISWIPIAAAGSLLLLESGSPDNLLLETGDNLLLE